MSDRRFIGLILLIIGGILIYFGFNDLSSSSVNVEVMDIEVSANSRTAQIRGIIEMGLGVLSAIIGLRYFKK